MITFEKFNSGVDLISKHQDTTGVHISPDTHYRAMIYFQEFDGAFTLEEIRQIYNIMLDM